MSVASDLGKELKKLKSVPCMDCKQTFDPVCMDFDHRPGEVKLGHVPWFTKKTPEEFWAEVAKCDVVCACCHRLRSKKRGFSPQTIEKLREAGKRAAKELWSRPGYTICGSKRAKRRQRLASGLWTSLNEIGAISV